MYPNNPFQDNEVKEVKEVKEIRKAAKIAARAAVRATDLQARIVTQIVSFTGVFYFVYYLLCVLTMSYIIRIGTGKGTEYSPIPSLAQYDEIKK